MRGIVFKTIFVRVIERDFFGDFLGREGEGLQAFFTPHTQLFTKNITPIPQ